jgi:hypothetical protein
MDDFSRLVSQASIPVGMKGKSFAKFESPQPPFHPDTVGARPDQRVQLTDAFLDYICRVHSDREPEGGVIAAHVFHSFGANRMHGTPEPAKMRFWQRIFE